MSKKLWLPIKKNLVALDLASSNSFVKKIKLTLPFSNIQIHKMSLMNSQMISWQLSLKIKEKKEDDNIIYSRKIQIMTNKSHRNLFNKCFGATRYFYNKAVYYSNEEYQKQKDDFNKSKVCIKCDSKLDKEEKVFCSKHKDSKLKFKITTSFITLRKQIMTNDKDLDDKEKWQKEIPHDTRVLAIKGFTESLKSALSNFKNGNINSFKMGYKSKKNKNQMCFIDKRAIDNLRIFKSRLKDKVRVRNKDKTYRTFKPECNCILKKEYNKYYLIIPKKKKVEYTKPQFNSVALDPGRNTFQTFYSPNGVCGKLGDNWYLELRKICNRIDLIQSLRSKLKNKSLKRKINKRKLEIRHFKLRTKMRNVVSDNHWKICDYLTKNYENIIISDFAIKNMKCYSLLNRDLRNQSHYKFRCKLESKCKERKNNLIVTTEEFTSKTCGGCGTINDVGLERVLNCKKCKLKIDRDYNGARNILLKHISRT
jgi:transposase